MIRRHRLAAPLLMMVAVLAVVLSGCTGASSPRKATASQLIGGNGAGPYLGFGLDPAQPRPSFTLTDTTGKPFTFGSTTAGHPTLLYFGYTNCPDVCPETMADAAVALRHVATSVSAATYVVFVSTDVKRDTGPVIAKWLANFSAGTHATFVGLRGTQAQIDAAQAAAHVAVAEDGGATHSAEMLLYGHDDYARVAYSQSTTQQKQLEHDLPLVAKA